METTNRVLAAVLGLLLLFGGLLVAVEIAAAAAGSEPLVIPYDDWYTELRRTPWSDGTVRAVLIGLIVVGVLLLLLQVLPRRAQSLRVRPLGGPETYAVHRRGLEGALRRAAEGVDGVHRAHARVGRRRVSVVAESSHRTSAGTRLNVERAVQRRLEESELDVPMELQVDLRDKASS